MDIRKILKDASIGALCSMSLLALFEPFGIDRIEEHRLLFIAAEGTLAVFVAMFSIWLVQLFVQKNSSQAISQRFIVLSGLAIHAINIPLLSAVLLTFNGWMNQHSLSSYWFFNGEFSLRGYREMVIYVAIVSIFVFVIQLFMAFNNKLKKQLDDVRAINNMLETRLERMSQQQEEKTEHPASDSVSIAKIQLKSSTSNSTLEVSPTDIIYIESMSNYADICYMKEDQISHQQLRITMKQLREQLADIEYLVSCHRAYIVNLNYVSSLSMRSGSDYYQLHLFGDEKQIPVSRSNTEEIKKRLS